MRTGKEKDGRWLDCRRQVTARWGRRGTDRREPADRRGAERSVAAATCTGWAALRWTRACPARHRDNSSAGGDDSDCAERSGRREGRERRKVEEGEEERGGREEGRRKVWLSACRLCPQHSALCRTLPRCAAGAVSQCCCCVLGRLAVYVLLLLLLVCRAATMLCCYHAGVLLLRRAGSSRRQLDHLLVSVARVEERVVQQLLDCRSVLRLGLQCFQYKVEQRLVLHSAQHLRQVVG